MQISISLSCCKYPSADSIPIIWRENLQPLMGLVQSLASGIRATITDKYGAPLREATVKIGGKSYGVSHNMAYFKMILVPGEYTLTVFCEGYVTQMLKDVPVRQGITNINVKLVQKDTTSLENHKKSESFQLQKTVNRALIELNAKYPQQTTLHSIGKTAKDNEIMCLEIGSNNDQKQTGRPAIIFSAGILRAEPATAEVLLHFASYLLDNYKQNATIAHYIDDFSIYVAPEFALDLNENPICSPELKGLQFPINEKLNGKAAMIASWFKDVNAVLAVNLNSGSRHIEIPFGRDYGKIRERKYESDDEDLLQHLASVYANARADKLSASTRCKQNSIIDNSVIHAAAGIGGRRSHPLMDYVYFNTSTLMIDVYITCCTTDHSIVVWKENKASLLACIQEMKKGVRGYITNEEGEPIDNVVLSYDKSPHLIKNSRSGFYSMLLPPGSHNITATAPGYHAETKLISTLSFEAKRFSRLMFKLARDIMITSKLRDV